MRAVSIFISVLMIAAVVGCKKAKPIDVKCYDSIKSLKIMDTSFSVICPANCKGGALWGTDMYTTDSSLCRAAAHAGIISTEGGLVNVEIKEGLKSYTGSERNGIKSNSWGSFEKSFVVKK